MPCLNTRELIDERYRLADEPVPRRNQAARQAVAALERIADRGEPLAIPRVIACVLDHRLAGFVGRAYPEFRRCARQASSSGSAPLDGP